MKKNKTSKPPQSEGNPGPKARVSQNVRREFITRQIRARGMLSLARINQFAKTPPSHAGLSADIEAINRNGFHIVPVESEGRTYLVDAAARHLGAKAVRMDLNAREKEEIALAAAALVFGLPDRGTQEEEESTSPTLNSKRGILCATNPEIKHWWTRPEVFKALVQGNDQVAVKENASKLWNKIEEIWREGVMTVFCDAGTTNERFGSLLRDVLIPTSFSDLNNLSLCTNSRSIFNAVADPEVPTKGICVGGSQMGVDGVTEALAGPLSEAFLAATKDSLTFAFAFLGTTVIDVGAGFILSDSHEEKSIKGMVTSSGRTHVRVVCADRSKIVSRPVRAGYRFCSISPNEIDLVITNAVSPSPAKTEEEKKEREHSARLIDEIRERGVPVIEAKFNALRTPTGEIQRGQTFRSRMSYYKAEELFTKLGFEMREDLPFQSRAMELWLNAVTDYFLHEAPDNVCKDLTDKVHALRKDTFLGKLMENTARVKALSPEREDAESDD